MYKNFISLVFIVALLLPVAGSTNDKREPEWGETSHPLSMPFSPFDGKVVLQTPPGFSWPYLSEIDFFKVTLLGPNHYKRTIVTTKNWLNWPEVLAPGHYSWHIEAIRDGVNSTLSKSFTFLVSDTAAVLLIPNSSNLLAHIKNIPHPRSFPRGEKRDHLITVVLSERTAEWKQLVQRVTNYSEQKLMAEPVIPSKISGQRREQQMTKRRIRGSTRKEIRAMLEAGFAYMISGHKGWCEEAKRRALHISSWDEHGTTGLYSHDKVFRNITFSLAVIYDWLFNELDLEERRIIASSINERLEELYRIYVKSDRFAQRPYDSHGWVHLGHMAVISAIMAGKNHETDVWAKEIIPLYIHSISPWGGSDGGFGNGTSYSSWNYRTSLLVWDMLHYSTGVNVYNNSWIRNYLYFMVYFLPPGTPVGAFGDGAEKRLEQVWAEVSSGYVLRMPSNLSNWYANNNSGVNSSRLDLLSASVAPEVPDIFDLYPPELPNAAFFPSIGWTAMHSDLTDNDRVSIYFKSSPYGSFNHSHADQNSFVINANGKRLAIDSGYYDWYGSPHWTQWYKQTRAHNGITFDGGQGQKINDKGASGDIIHFKHHDEYDMVIGDASQAYNGKVSKARRTLLYVRPGTIVVYDRLSSDEKRFWEWNIHSLHKMITSNQKTVMISNKGTKLCVQMLEPRKISFNQTKQFTVAPDFPGKEVPDQWHGRFSTDEKSMDVEFLTVLQVNCRENNFVDKVERMPEQ